MILRLALFLAMVATACSNQAKPVQTEVSEPQLEPTTESAAAGTAKSEPADRAKSSAKISSFRLGSDCPDKKNDQTKKELAAKPSKKMRQLPKDWSPPCHQTNVVLSIEGPINSKVKLLSVTVSEKEGTLQSEFSPRLPTKWNNEKSGYLAWDEKLVSNESHQVSYKLSAPKWQDRRPNGNKELVAKVVVQVGSETLTTTLPVVLMVYPRKVT